MPDQEKVNIYESERGGLRISDVDVEFMEARWGGWAYPGKADLGEQLAAIFMLKIIGSEDAELEEQVWTAGSLSDWEPSEDGKTLRSLGPGHIRDTTNWILFTNTLREKGLQMEKLDPNDITDLVGLKCHLMTEKVDRPGLDNPDGRVLVCSQLITSPWEKKSASKKTRTKRTAAAKPDGAPSPPPADVDQETAGLLLMEAISEGTPVDIPDLIKRVFLAAKGAGKTAEFMSLSNLIRDPAQLEPVLENLGFKLDGKTVS